MKKKIDIKKALDANVINAFLEGFGLSENSEDFIEGVAKEIELRAKEQAKLVKNKKRISVNDAAKVHAKATDVLSEEDISKLPKWVQKEIDEAQIIGASGDVIQVQSGSKFHRRNKLNDLPGGKWTFFLNSVINTRYPTSGVESYAHEIRKIHPSPKPPQLMREIIEFFTKENELVLDYFMGVGGSLLGASLSNRRAIGIDLNGEYIAAYKKASKSLELQEQVTIEGDAIQILADEKMLTQILKAEKVSLILIDPPYGDMLAREKTGEAAKNKASKSPTPFTDLSIDLGNMSIEEFFPIFQRSVTNAMKYLKPRGHIAVFMKDLQPIKGSPNLLHAKTIDVLSEINGLEYIGMKIWADQSVNLYPYGYPYSYVSNQIHQYIMFFRID